MMGQNSFYDNENGETFSGFGLAVARASLGWL